MGEGYIHGYSADEQRRLTLMQTILNDAELGALDLRGVGRILDVGCGLGQMTRALARAAGRGVRVLGIEREPRQMAEAERQAEEAGETGAVEFRAGRAESLPLRPGERGGFDLVHARFLLEHLPDPAAAVREMVAAARPAGGRIVLVDDDHDVLRVWPACAPFENVWRSYWESFEDRGLDPLIGRRLPALLRDAGATPTRVTTVFYGAQRGDTLFDAVVDNLIGVLDGAAAGLESSGRVSAARMQEAREALGAWRAQESATLWYSLPLAEGRREP